MYIDVISSSSNRSAVDVAMASSTVAAAAAAAAAADSRRLFDELLDVEVAIDMPKLRDAARLGVPTAVRSTVYSYLLGIALGDRSAEVTMERVQERDFCQLVEASKATWRSCGGVGSSGHAGSNSSGSGGVASSDGNAAATTATTNAATVAQCVSPLYVATLQSRIDAALLTRMLQQQYGGNDMAARACRCTAAATANNNNDDDDVPCLAVLQGSTQLSDYSYRTRCRDDSNNNSNGCDDDGGDVTDDIVRCQAAWSAAVYRVQQYMSLLPLHDHDDCARRWRASACSASTTAAAATATAAAAAAVHDREVWQLRRRRRRDGVERVLAALRYVHHDVPPKHVDVLVTFTLTLEHAFSLAAAAAAAHEHRDAVSMCAAPPPQTQQQQPQRRVDDKSNNDNYSSRSSVAGRDDDDEDDEAGDGDDGAAAARHHAVDNDDDEDNSRKQQRRADGAAHGHDASRAAMTTATTTTTTVASAAAAPVAHARDVFFAVQALYDVLTHHGNVLQDDAALQTHCGVFLMLFHAVHRTLYEHFVREGVCVADWLPDLLCGLFADRAHRDDVLPLWDVYVADARAQLGFALHPFVCLATLSMLADELLECDACGIVHRLRHLPRLHAVALLHKAVSLREHVRESGLLSPS